MSAARNFAILTILCPLICVANPNNIASSDDASSVWTAHTYLALSYVADSSVTSSNKDSYSEFNGGVAMTKGRFYLGFKSVVQGLFKQENRTMKTDFGGGYLSEYDRSFRYNLNLGEQIDASKVSTYSDKASLSAKMIWRNFLGLGYQYAYDQIYESQNSVAVFVQRTFGRSKQHWIAFGDQLNRHTGMFFNDYYAQYSYRLNLTPVDEPEPWYVGIYYSHQGDINFNSVGVTLQHGLNFINSMFPGDIFRPRS